MAAPQPLDHPSPNHGARRDGLTPELIVLHYTAMQTAAAALDRLSDPAAEVSAHYLVSETGQVWRMVAEDRRAWHAGVGRWQGRGDVNSRSIGIELANTGSHPFPAPQMAALHGLMRRAMDRWSIPPQGVIAHSDLAPGRKSDPGPRFDWRALALRGLSVWPGPIAPRSAAEALSDTAAESYFADLARFGYGLPSPDAQGRISLHSAFRLRFRPWASGPPDALDAALAQDLAARFGVDGAQHTA